MTVLNAVENAIAEVEEAIERLPRVPATAIGLDIRAGYVYIDEDDNVIIADRNNIRTLDYYGGFEYVDEDAVINFGDYKIYRGDYDGRVGSALDYYAEYSDE